MRIAINPARVMRRPRARSAALLVALAAALGCEGGSSAAPVPTVTTVEITPAGRTIDAGTTLALQATAKDGSGRAIAGRPATWRSDAPAVATVDGAGVVTGVSAGTAPIAVTIDGVTGTASVTVREEVVASADSIGLSDIGLTAAFTVTRNGQPVANPELRVVQERRWMSDNAVLSAAALAQGRITSTAPGRVRVEVSAGNAADTITIGVSLPAPRIFGAFSPGGAVAVGDADTLVLRGYNFTALPVSALQGEGFTLTSVSRDSSNWRIVIPSRVVACGAPGGQTPPLVLTLGGLPFTTTFQRRDANDVALPVGGARRLTAAEASCMSFASGLFSQRYMLAYADTRLHQRAQGAPEAGALDSMTVRVTPIGLNPAPATLTSARAGILFERAARVLRPSRMVPAGCPAANATAPHCRTTPWTLGETFTHYTAAGAAVPARVVSVRGNLVLAVVRADSALLASNTIERADSALAALATTGVPWLQYVFGLTEPVKSSDESGQLLIVLDNSAPSTASWHVDNGTDTGRWARITIGLPAGSPFRTTNTVYSALLSEIAHELAHAYQYRWRYQHAGPWRGPLGTTWAVEGGATFIQLQLLREALGVAFAANGRYRDLPATDKLSPLDLGTRVSGDVTDGFVPAAALMRDLTQRLIGPTMNARDASRAVIVGALEGWYGINEEGQSRGQGLVARVRARLGAGWTPADGMLTWAMSDVADETLVGETVFQNSSYTSTSMIRPGPVGWIMAPHDTVSATNAASVRRAPGNAGAFIIHPSPNLYIRAEALVGGAPSSSVEWMLYRWR